jgi:hypothetical protein
VPTVAYAYQFPYRHGHAGGLFPILPITITNPRQPSRAVDTIVHLDSGAQRSLFDGTLAGQQVGFASYSSEPASGVG